MDLQMMINIMLGLIAFLGGWVMHSFKSQLNDNKDEIRDAKDRVHAVEVLVAGKYITKEEMTGHTDRVLDELKGIRDDIKSCMLQKRRKDDNHEC